MNKIEQIRTAPGDLYEDLARSGLATGRIEELRHAEPRLSGDFPEDCERYSRYWRQTADLTDDLKANSADTAAATKALETAARARRREFLSRHARALYAELTDGFTAAVRVRDLMAKAARAVPGLVPDERQLEAEKTRPLKDKSGIERDQGLLLSAILSDAQCGDHLCRSMLRPLPESLELLDNFEADGEIDLGHATVKRRGAALVLTMRNPETLNAEDEASLRALEIATDLCLLDRRSDLCVLRGGPVASRRYAGKRVFSSGINLTDLYWGRISYLFYMTRDMGFVNKLYRGLLLDDGDAGGEPETREKPWIGVIEEFAIGGGCQLALVMDYIIADENAYFTLPARKEGIIPGAANLRLPRLIGDKAARQAIIADRRIDAESDTGRLLCDETAPRGEIDALLDRTIGNLTDAGLVSAAGNKKALRLSAEPFDLFRRYMALYAIEQADCHLSGQLVRNLEKNWNAAERKPKAAAKKPLQDRG